MIRKLSSNNVSLRHDHYTTCRTSYLAFRTDLQSTEPCYFDPLQIFEYLRPDQRTTRTYAQPRIESSSEHDFRKVRTDNHLRVDTRNSRVRPHLGNTSN